MDSEWIHVRVLLFASLREIAQQREVLIELPVGATVADLKVALAQQFPLLAPHLPSVLTAINREYAGVDESIPAEAEIAIFPPVSGGSFPTIFAITEDALDLDSLVAAITLPTTGAACIFTGMVRAQTGRSELHETLFLEYEAYQPMAEAKLQQVAEEIRQHWPAVEGIAIVQRVGHLYPGTPTVAVACTAAHRDTGVFEAARYGIDRLKEIVPVWKREVSPQGQSWVEGSYFPESGE